MELKGKIKPQEAVKKHKESPFTFHPSSLREPLSDNRSMANATKPQKEDKDEKIQDLYDVKVVLSKMMRKIL